MHSAFQTKKIYFKKLKFRKLISLIQLFYIYTSYVRTLVHSSHSSKTRGKSLSPWGNPEHSIQVFSMRKVLSPLSLGALFELIVNLIFS